MADHPPQGRGKTKVEFLQVADDDARRCLNGLQNAYAVRIARKLKDWGDVEALSCLRIEAVEDFYELKLKGNVLGKINLRVYFAYLQECNTIMILGVYIKNEEGKTPKYVLIKMRARLRQVNKSELRPPPKSSSLK